MVGVVYLEKNTTFAAVKFQKYDRSGAVKAASLLVLFISLWCSSNLFYHTHLVDSEVVTHSHPYTSASHTHSGVEIQTIALLSFSVAILVLSMVLLLIDIRVKISENYNKFYNADPFSGALHSFRAPPAVC